MGDSVSFTLDDEPCFMKLLFNFGQQVSVRYGIGDRGSQALETISTDDMREFRAWLFNGAGKKRKASNKTVANKIKTITSFFASAVLEGLIDTNPAQALAKLKADEVLRRQPFTLTEVDTLIKSAPDRDWRGLITIGAFTGLRLGDCLNLKWSNIHLRESYIEVIPQKTQNKNREVQIPIVPVLMAFFVETPAKERKGDVLPALAQRKVSGRTSVSVNFIAIMAKAGVSRGESINNGCITKYEKSFHSLRHTLTTMLSNANVPEEVRMEILGHSTREVHAGYTHFDMKTLADAMSSIPTLTTKD
jgi:integrase